jgi:hypothetical protein
MNGKRWDLTDLVGISDIAKTLDATMPTVSNWRTRYPDFPKPLCRIGNRDVYSLKQITRWYKQFQ